MVSYETIERALHRLDHRLGSLSVNDGTLRTTATFTSGTISVDKGTVNIDFSTIPSGTLKVDVVASVLTGANPTDGTLSIVTQIGTLPNVMIGGGTIDYLNTITQIGTLPNLVIGSGTVEVSGFSGGVMGISDGTLTSLPNIVVGSGTLQSVGTVYYQNNLGTLYAVTGNVKTIPQSGTLQQITAVTQIGTLPNIIVGSGTLQQITNCYLAGAGTVKITDGTLSNVTVTGGTLNANGTVTATGTLNAIIESGTLTSLGSANIYSKHDLHVYDTLGTIRTAVGTLIQTASKIIKVHQYSIMTDGTLAYSFNDAAPNGGTVDCGGVFYQREGREKPFIPYPGYHFKTSTVGSALCLGTYAPGMSGTAYIHIVYTDDDTS